MADQLVAAGGEALLTQVAEMVRNQTKLRAKFVDFLKEHAPPLREPRPPEWGRLGLSSRRKEDSVYTKIYEYRARALHAGKAFPLPMCWPPHVFDRDADGEFKGARTEKPGGFGMGVGNACWRVEDTPILLDAFVYLVRGALLHWWESMLSARL